ncbi:MAG: hypothetical protein IJX17_06360, partial [Clostridia bacterium]|nr:hypothetical protein [Clostridia bacterium]
MGVQLSYTYSNPYYETSMTGFVNITEEEIQKYGFDLIGRLPDKPNEICLSKHIFDIICELSKNSDNPVTDIDNLKINFDNRTEYHTVVGIVDDKKDLSNLKDLDEETDYMKIMMIRSQIDYGFSRMAYVCEEEYNRILNEGVDTHISLEFKNSGYGIDKDYLYTFEKALETYYDEKSHYESCQIEFINSTYNHKLYLEGNGKEYYYWEIWDEHNNLLYKYNYYNQKFEDGNGYPLEEEAINTIFSRYGLDNNGDGIPDEFKDNVNKLFYEDYVTYIKNDGTLLVNGKIKDIGENEILLPQE